jgi:hypothetical protein
VRLARILSSLVALIALAMVVSGSATEQRAAVANVAPVLCPTDVVGRDSMLAPVAEVLRAAQGELARMTLNTQGTVRHLTPRNAPIDFIERLATFGRAAPLDKRVPGLVVTHRAAALACGEAMAQASWAIHYDLPFSLIAGQGGWQFFVKTGAGWRSWGNWCGAGQTRAWRSTYCT